MTDLIDILNGKSDNKNNKSEGKNKPKDSLNNNEDKSNKKEKKEKKEKPKKQEDKEPNKITIYGRIPKEIKFEEERKEVLCKLLNILGINDDNKVFYINDLEKDQIKQKMIIELLSDIRKYFSCGKWVYFRKKTIMPYTSLCRSILKDMKVKVTTMAIRDNETNKTEKRGFKIHLSG